MADTTSLLVNLFDGTRHPFHADVNVLVQVFRPQPNKPPLVANAKGNSFRFDDLPFNDSPDDDLRVTIFAKHHYEAGFFPVTMPKNDTRELDLMLVPKPYQFVFNRSAWDQLSNNRQELFEVLGGGTADDAAAKARYERLMKQDPASLAALLNISTAISDISLPRDSGTTALSYFKNLIWNSNGGPDWDPASPEAPKQDRFYAYATLELRDRIVAAPKGDFSKEPLPGLPHPGATLSYKQNQFGEANVQFTFHEKALSPPGLVKVECDIDYFADPVSHAILEVIPNHFTHGKTTPLMAYALRWMAAKAQDGLPEFDPLYIIQSQAA